MPKSASDSNLSAIRQSYLTKWFDLYDPSPDVEDPLEEIPADLRTASDLGIPLPEPLESVEPQPGDIRLMAPGKIPELTRPVYMAILGPWAGQDMVAAAPFSAYPVPALQSELYFPDQECGLLRTLCLWNTRSIPIWSFYDSWAAGSLSGQMLSDARKVFRSQFLGAALPAELLQRTAPPITEGNDPRHAYIRSEIDLLAPLQSDAASAIRVHKLLESIGEIEEDPDLEPLRPDGQPLTEEHRKTVSFPLPSVSFLLAHAAEGVFAHASSSQVCSAAIFDGTVNELLGRLLSRRPMRSPLQVAQAEVIIPLSPPTAPDSPLVAQWRLLPRTGTDVSHLRGFLLLNAKDKMTLVGKGGLNGSVATLAKGSWARVCEAAAHARWQFLVFHR